jgi:hypothetical protein
MKRTGNCSFQNRGFQCDIDVILKLRIGVYDRFEPLQGSIEMSTKDRNIRLKRCDLSLKVPKGLIECVRTPPQKRGYTSDVQTPVIDELTP